MSPGMSAWNEVSSIIDKDKKLKERQIDLLEDLIIAVCHSNFEDVFYLLRNGASVNGILDERITPLSVAVLEDNLDMVKALIQKGADPNLIFDEGIDAFSLATTLNYNKICNFLQENGSRIKKYRMLNTYETRLITATKASNPHVVKYILSKDRESVNFYDSNGKTALHYNLAKEPFSNNDALITEMLIAANADRNAIDIDGFKPTDYVAEAETSKLQSVLDKATIKQITQKGVEALKAREQKQKQKEQEFINKDIKEVFQPKMPSAKTLGKMKRFNII